MAVFNISKEMFSNGVFTFENGNYIFIEDIMYSSDGLYWEDTFNPSSHQDPRDPSNTLSGHKWRKVRHAGDAAYQLAEYIVAEDGKTPVFRVNNGNLEYKYMDEEDTAYQVLVSVSELQGEKGAKGDNGAGWHVDIVSYWLEKPDCSSSICTTTPTCSTCSTTTTAASTSSVPTLMLSLGDGLKEIVIGDAGKYRSNDGTTWVLIVASDVGVLTRFIANDAIGTGSIDYHTQDTLSTKGKVYYCNEGAWSLFLNVAVSDHKVAPTAAFEAAFHSGYFMEDYVDSPLNSHPIKDTLALTTDFALVVKQNSIEPLHLKDGSFGNGLDEGSVNADGIKGSTIKVNVDDLDGFGLDTYTRGDGFDDLEVDVRQLVGNGLQAYDDSAHASDGEDKYMIIPKFSDYIASASGLEYVVGGDTFEDLQVKGGHGLELTTNGVDVNPDDLSVYINSSDEVAVKPYSAGNDGVMATHLNPDVVNEDKGLSLDNTTGIAIDLSIEHTALGFLLGDLLVLENGIQGWHLNPNVVDEDEGVTFDAINNKIQAKVVSGGGIETTTNGLQIDTSDLSWLSSDVVRSIEVGSVKMAGLLGLEGSTADPYMDITVTNVGQVITVAASTDITALQGLINSLIPAGVAAHTQDWTTITGTPDFLVEDTVYGNNIKITSNGLFIKAATKDEWGKLISVDDDFNLGVDSNVAP